MRDNLLQRLLTEAGFLYLSDLHSGYHVREVYDAVCRLSPDEYPLKEWEEAADYILGQKEKTYGTAGAAHGFLKDELAKAASVRQKAKRTKIGKKESPRD